MSDNAKQFIELVAEARAKEAMADKAEEQGLYSLAESFERQADDRRAAAETLRQKGL